MMEVWEGVREVSKGSELLNWRAVGTRLLVSSHRQGRKEWCSVMRLGWELSGE